MNSTAPNLNFLGNGLKASYTIVYLRKAELLALALC